MTSPTFRTTQRIFKPRDQQSINLKTLKVLIQDRSSMEKAKSFFAEID